MSVDVRLSDGWYRVWHTSNSEVEVVCGGDVGCALSDELLWNSSDKGVLV